ncbi:MAG: peptidyl-prolyl cis-trans isomerase [Acidobacteriota bacterium]
MIRVLSTVLMALVSCSGAACRKPPSAATTASAASPAQSGAPGTARPSGATAAQGTPGGTPPPTAPPVKPVPAQLPEVLARVNGEAVKKADLDRLIKNMEMSANQPIPPERRDEILRRALDQLVTYTVLSQETRARKVTVTDAEIDSNLKQMQSQFPNEAEFTKALAARGTTLERLRADARVDMSINRMVEAEVASTPPPTDAQAREFYDKNPDKFKQEEAIRASHILIPADEKADEATKKKARAEADEVLKELKAGGDFAELAKKHSKDSSAAQGGDLNFFPKGQMVPAFDQAAWALKPGEISDVVTTPFGFHIIKVTERRPASTVPFDQVSGRIKEYLAQQQKQERASAFIESLKQKAKIEVLV